jgi:hypothetical protein
LFVIPLVCHSEEFSVIQAVRFASMVASLSVLIFLPLGLMVSPMAHAVTGAGFELGRGNDSTQLARVTARWDWNNYWSLSQNWVASGFWEVGLGHWQGDRVGAEKIWDLGFTPVFRARSGVSLFYLEGAIGAHWLSSSKVNERRSLGCRFNFGDHVGFGWNFGEKDRYELGYRFQHLSNCSIKQPNDGINFHQLRLGYNY